MADDRRRIKNNIWCFNIYFSPDNSINLSWIHYFNNEVFNPMTKNIEGEKKDEVTIRRQVACPVSHQNLMYCQQCGWGVMNPGKKDDCQEKLAHLENFYKKFAQAEYDRGVWDERNRMLKDLPEEGIKWMQEGHNKDRKGYTEGYNRTLQEIKKIIINPYDN